MTHKKVFFKLQIFTTINFSFSTYDKTNKNLQNILLCAIEYKYDTVPMWWWVTRHNAQHFKHDTAADSIITSTWACIDSIKPLLWWLTTASYSKWNTGAQFNKSVSNLIPWITTYSAGCCHSSSTDRYRSIANKWHRRLPPVTELWQNGWLHDLACAGYRTTGQTDGWTDWQIPAWHFGLVVPNTG